VELWVNKVELMIEKLTASQAGPWEMGLPSP
jgi:hypothetical protein